MMPGKSGPQLAERLKRFRPDMKVMFVSGCPHDDLDRDPAFARTVAEAALIACSPDCALLRPVLVELKRRYPED